VTDCLENVELWDKRGIGLHIVDLGGSSIDTRSPTGRFMLTVMAAAAELERGMIAQRTSTAQRHYMFEGRRIMTRKDQCPYGWVIDPQDDTKMVEVPKEQELCG
jgi:DNA invertase Pin-like site-specific DNA recombinase